MKRIVVSCVGIIALSVPSAFTPNSLIDGSEVILSGNNLTPAQESTLGHNLPDVSLEFNTT